MSNLVIRALVEKDWLWLDKLPGAAGPDRRGVESPGAYTFVCLENDKPVGVAVGSADTGGGDTCFLKYVRTFIPGRWDVILALMQRHAQNGIDTGHKWAVATVPFDGQCTNVATTTELTAELTAKVGIRWRDEGFKAAARVVAAKATEPVELLPLVAALKIELETLGCNVERT